MRDRLSIKASMLLPQTLADCYSLSHFDRKLKGILLSKFGIFQRAHDDDENDDTHIYIPANPGVVSSRGRSRNEPLYGCFCDECLPVIMEPVKKKRHHGRIHFYFEMCDDILNIIHGATTEASYFFNVKSITLYKLFAGAK